MIASSLTIPEQFASPKQRRLVFLDEDTEGSERLPVLNGEQKEPDKVEERVLVRGPALDRRVGLGEGLQRVRGLDVLAKADVLRNKSRR